MGELISVIIPCYNREKLIDKSVRSVLHQTYTNIEVIVVDDCSTDDSVKVLDRINDSRLRYYVLEKNSGACAARNYGIEHSNGDYVAFQDSDDYWHENKIDRQLETLKKTGSDFVFCGMNRYMEGKNKPFYYPVYKVSNQKPIYKQVLRENCIATVSMFMKKEVANNIGFDVRLKRYQDWDFAFRASKEYKTYYHAEALVDSWIQKDSISNTTNEYEMLYDFYKIHEEEILKDDSISAHFYSRMAGNIRKTDKCGAIELYKKSLNAKFDIKVLIIYGLSRIGIMQIIDKYR